MFRFVDIQLCFEALAPQVQAALIQVCGTAVAAFAALIGVAATILFSRWKHREDRELAIKRDVMLEFLNAATDYTAGWFNFAIEPPESPATELARSTTKVRLVTNAETIDLVEKEVAFLTSSTNRLREIKRAISPIRKRISNAQPDEVEAVRKELEVAFDVGLKECDELHGKLSIHTNTLLSQFRKELKLSSVRRFSEVRDLGSDNIITEIKKARESGFRHA